MENIIDVLVDNNSILDTVLKEIRIFSNDIESLNIELTLSNFRKESKFTEVRLIFKNVFEYNFYHNKDYIFYNVENFKFLRVNDGVYISLDPDEDVNGKSENDMDFIHARDVELIEL